MAVGYDNKTKEFSLGITEGNLEAQPVDFITIKASDISFNDGNLDLAEASLALDLPLDLGFNTKVNNLHIDKEGADWDTIEFKIEPFTLWNYVDFTETKAVVAGKGKDYETIIQEGLGRTSVITLVWKAVAGSNSTLTIKNWTWKKWRLRLKEV